MVTLHMLAVVGDLEHASARANHGIGVTTLHVSLVHEQPHGNMLSSAEWKESRPSGNDSDTTLRSDKSVSILYVPCTACGSFRSSVRRLLFLLYHVNVHMYPTL